MCEKYVLQETGKELPYGRDEKGSYYIGDLYVCGPTVMKGYLGDAAKENENTIFYRNGVKYIKTGDKAYIDEEGRLWFIFSMCFFISMPVKCIKLLERKITSTLLPFHLAPKENIAMGDRGRQLPDAKVWILDEPTALGL